MFLFYFINYQLARTLWNRDNFFAIPLQFCDRGLSFISNYTCLDEENYGRRNECFFFQFSIKGERKREKKRKEKETCSRASTNNLALILMRVISFGVPAKDLCAFQPLKRISNVDLLS